MKKLLMITGIFSFMLIGTVFAKTVSNEEPTMCTMQYMPVCASVAVQCIKAPCPPIEQTFGNACMMNANKLATYLHDGECTTNVLANTTWNIQSFDNKTATGANISFESDRISANICNIFNGDYTLDGDTFVVGPMISTMMACIGDIATYERAFDLSGAKFELSTDGGNHLMITTLAGHKFQWSKEKPTIGKPIGMANPASVYCTEHSGSLIILNGTDGEYGMCNFPDGSQCEEWSYFRGECKSVTTKLEAVMNTALSTRKYTEEGFKQFFVDLKAKVNLGVDSTTGMLRKAYLQIQNFLKNF